MTIEYDRHIRESLDRRLQQTLEGRELLFHHEDIIDLVVPHLLREISDSLQKIQESLHGIEMNTQYRRE